MVRLETCKNIPRTDTESAWGFGVSWNRPVSAPHVAAESWCTMASVQYGEYGKVHTEPWRDRIAEVARGASYSEGVTEGGLLKTVDRALKHGNLSLDAFLDARIAVVRGVGPRLNA